MAEAQGCKWIKAADQLTKREHPGLSRWAQCDHKGTSEWKEVGEGQSDMI